jgi:acetoin utilization deacetylase AcuC-like enzyme
VLEGGYHLEGIAESAKKTLLTLIDDHRAVTQNKPPEKPLLETETVMKMVKRVHAAFWKALA